MGGRSLIDLSTWSTDDLCEAEDAIDGALLAVIKAKPGGGPRDAALAADALELKLTKEVSGAWKKAASKGLVSSLKTLLRGKATPARIKTFIGKLGVGLNRPLTDKQAGVIKSRLTSIWKITKRIASREAKIPFSFAAKDVEAIAALGRQQLFWIGNLYDQHLSARISAVASDVLLEQGLSQAEAGKAVEEALRAEMGLRPGGRSQFARAIPSRYAGNTDLYFRQVVANAAHQARSFSKMTAFGEAGIVRFRLINPNDERTGTVCQQMHGQVFTVKDGVKQMNAMLAATTPQDIKDAAPWLSAGTLEEELEGKRRGSPAATDALLNVDASVLPPFHPLCRTEPVIID